METIDFNEVIRDPETISVVGELMSNNKLFPFMDRGVVNNFNTANESGIYFIVDDPLEKEGNPGVNYGVLVVFKAKYSSSKYISQLAFHATATKLYYRTAVSEESLANAVWVKIVQS